jgi:K+-sensing histidine kinase KdpD
MNRIDRLFQRYIRDLTIGPPTRPARRRAETLEPRGRTTPASWRLTVAYALAIILPVSTAAVLILVRENHARTTAVILVIPVVIVAVLGATGPAVVAALSAGLAYDVFLTRPYYHVVIDDTDDITTTIVLGIVALAVGLLSSRLIRITARDVARGGQLHHLLEFVQTTRSVDTETELTEAACRHISGVLHLRSCRWRADYHGGTSPTLLATGGITGRATAMNPDRAELPATLELPAVVGTTELGRFILESPADQVSSREERLTAAAIASICAGVVRQRSLG